MVQFIKQPFIVLTVDHPDEAPLLRQSHVLERNPAATVRRSPVYARNAIDRIWRHEHR